MEIIIKELNNFNKLMSDIISESNNEILSDINSFIFSKSKQLRPKLIILFAKALNFTFSDKLYYLTCAAELIHNSTLIHDDIIDEADTRRGHISLNKKLGNNLSVLAGDYILSCALNALAKCENNKIINTFSNSLSVLCEAEINQQFSRNKIPVMEEYIKKSEKKTAELFKASLISLVILNQSENIIPQITDFAVNYGIAFQIKDDYNNIYNTDTSKPILNDISEGIYTAPVIFLKSKGYNIENLEREEIINKIRNDNSIKKQTKELIEIHAKKAIASIRFIKDNQYKKTIIELTRNLYKAEMNE